MPPTSRRATGLPQPLFATSDQLQRRPYSSLGSASAKGAGFASSFDPLERDTLSSRPVLAMHPTRKYFRGPDSAHNEESRASSTSSNAKTPQPEAEAWDGEISDSGESDMDPRDIPQTRSSPSLPRSLQTSPIRQRASSNLPSDAPFQSPPQSPTLVVHPLPRHSLLPPSPRSPTSLSSPPPTPRTRTRTRTRTADLAHWAPETQRPSQSRHAHLPDSSSAGPTSFVLPPSQIQQELEYSVKRLLSPAVFEAFVSDPAGRRRFLEYLDNTARGRAPLELWWDLRMMQRAAQQARVAAVAVTDVYLVQEAKNEVLLPDAVLREAVEALRGMMWVGGLEGPAQHLLSSLYVNEFQGFVKHRLLKHATVQLGKYNLSASERAGLGDAFCLTNPRMRDQPIVLCSPAFCAITGYSAQQIIGRNCRFLQGSATSPSSVMTIRKAIDAGEAVTQLLLNYRADGSAFWNLLCILPLRDTRGEVTYHIGGQTNVTGAMAAGSNVSFLLGGDDPSQALTPSDREGTFSDAVQHHALQQQSRLFLDSSHQRDVDLSAPAFVPPSFQSSIPSINLSFQDTPAPASRLGSFFIKTKQKSNKLAKGNKDPASQTVMGAEAQLGGQAAPIEDRIAEFSATYEKVLMFRREGREILFVTSAFLRFCGLPGATAQEVHSSPLVHMDILDLITADTKAETKDLRTMLKSAIRDGMSLSVSCGIRLRKRSFFGRKDGRTSVVGTLHLTPLLDSLGEAVAFVAVFG